MFHRLLLALAFAGFACSSVAAPWTKAADPSWHAPQLTASGVTGTLGGSPRDLDPDPAFGYGTGQMTYDLGHANAPREEGLRVYAMAGDAGWYVLARHARQDGGWDAVVVQVNPNGEGVDEFLLQTPLWYIEDAVMDPATGKFYFVGSGHNPVLPGDDFDFAVTCMDITIAPDGGPCGGFGVSGTAWVGFNLGDGNDEMALRVVVRPNIGLILAGMVFHANKTSSVAVASLYRASGALYTSFGTNGRFVHSINTTSPESQANVEGMVLSNDSDAETRVYIAGSYTVDDAHDNTDGYVLALKAMTGVLDTSFSGDGIQPVTLDSSGCSTSCRDDQLTALAVQVDGKLALAGVVLAEPVLARPLSDDAIAGNASVVQPMLGRLNVDGSLDLNFHSTGLFPVGDNWPGHGGITPQAIAERPNTRELVVAMKYRASTNWSVPPLQLLGQWSADGNTLHATASFAFDVAEPTSPEVEPRSLLVDADSAMMVGSRQWLAADYDITLVRTLVDKDFLFSDGFE